MKQRNQVVLTSIILTIALLGDAYLYLALPLYFESFGLTLLWVGVILSINRFVRLVLNSLIVTCIHKFGYKPMLILASICASVSTAMYGFADSISFFIWARIIWAVSYSILRIISLSFATLKRKKSSYLLGLFHSIQEIGPILVLLIGPLLINSISLQDFYLILAAITFLTLPLLGTAK